MEEKKQEDKISQEQLEKPKLKSKKKLYIIILIAVVLLGAGVGFYFFNKKHKSADQEQSSKTEDVEKKPKEKDEELFLNLEDFIVNLQEGDKQPSFLKMEVTLQISNKQTLDIVQAKMPIIQDNFQTYLRELRADDLQGSAGIYRLREELLLRINKITFPNKVNDILFREILVQ